MAGDGSQHQRDHHWHQTCCCRMVKQGEGRVVNITGGGTVAPHVFASAYSASKAAIARFSETVAMELRSIDSPVRVFTVRPGLVLNERTSDLADSEACKKFGPDITEKINNGSIPMSTPDMVGDFIGYVASGALDDNDARECYNRKGNMHSQLFSNEDL